MMSVARILSVCAIVFLANLATTAHAAKRSAAAKHEFQRKQPCPATGQQRGKCPGYVIDHIKPLCAGGPDVPANMQWQTLADSKAKDVEERRYCQALKGTH